MHDTFGDHERIRAKCTDAGQASLTPLTLRLRTWERLRGFLLHFRFRGPEDQDLFARADLPGVFNALERDVDKRHRLLGVHARHPVLDNPVYDLAVRALLLARAAHMPEGAVHSDE